VEEGCKFIVEVRSGTASLSARKIFLDRNLLIGYKIIQRQLEGVIHYLLTANYDVP